MVDASNVCTELSNSCINKVLQRQIKESITNKKGINIPRQEIEELS
jgi:hypothetical protein